MLSGLIYFFAPCIFISEIQHNYVIPQTHSSFSLTEALFIHDLLPVGTSAVAASLNLVPRALFPGFGDGAGKGPGIGWPIRHFNWLIDLGNSGK